MTRRRMDKPFGGWYGRRSHTAFQAECWYGHGVLFDQELWVDLQIIFWRSFHGFVT